MDSRSRSSARRQAGKQGGAALKQDGVNSGAHSSPAPARHPECVSISNKSRRLGLGKKEMSPLKALLSPKLVQKNIIRFR